MLQGLLSKHMVETLSQNIIIMTVGKMRVHKLKCCQGCSQSVACRWPSHPQCFSVSCVWHLYLYCKHYRGFLNPRNPTSDMLFTVLSVCFTTNCPRLEKGFFLMIELHPRGNVFLVFIVVGWAVVSGASTNSNVMDISRKSTFRPCLHVAANIARLSTENCVFRGTTCRPQGSDWKFGRHFLSSERKGCHHLRENNWQHLLPRIKVGTSKQI